jgi:lipoprotein-releasing system permease protein
MFKPIPVAIGLRYLRAKRRNGFISFISMASILGIALGVTVLITTLAVMSGFQKEIRDRLLQMTAHTTITADGAPMADWQHAVEVAHKDPRVVPRRTSKSRPCSAAPACRVRSCRASIRRWSRRCR